MHLHSNMHVPLEFIERSTLYSPYLNAKGFVNLILHRQTMAVPAKPPVNMETTLVGITSHHILSKRCTHL